MIFFSKISLGRGGCAQEWFCADAKAPKAPKAHLTISFLMQGLSTWGQRHSSLQKAWGVYVRLLGLDRGVTRGRGRQRRSSGRGKDQDKDHPLFLRDANGLYADKYLEIAAHFNQKGMRCPLEV